MDRMAYREIDKFTKYNDTKEIVKSKPKYDDLWDRCNALENFYEDIKELITNSIYDCQEYQCCGFSGKSKSEIIELFDKFEQKLAEMKGEN